MQLPRVAPITMKELNRYDFTNDKSFVTLLLSAEDQQRIGAPECDVIGLQRWINDDEYTLVMRPDEALILARLLIDAVWQVTEGYSVGKPKRQVTCYDLTEERPPVTIELD